MFHLSTEAYHKHIPMIVRQHPVINKTECDCEYGHACSTNPSSMALIFIAKKFFVIFMKIKKSLKF